ncbi:MAG: GNAT family N-acetyltransferase, partial [Enterocloster sp.]
MNYRFATKEDIPQLMIMVEQAKEGFRARGISQWQKGEPNAEGLAAAIDRKAVHVLEEAGQPIGMITVVSGPELSYRTIDGAWLNDEPYCAFHRVCVEESHKGQGIASRLFACSEEYAKKQGFTNVRIDTHPDNLSMQRALAKSGFVKCGSLILADGSEKGDPRLGYQKVL